MSNIIVIIAIVFFFATGISLLHHSKECSAKGGVIVHGTLGFKCVRGIE